MRGAGRRGQDDPRGVVHGVIVIDEHLVLHTRLGRPTPDRGSDPLRFVTGGDEDRHSREPSRRPDAPEPWKRSVIEQGMQSHPCESTADEDVTNASPGHPEG
jgi:hypothetical protein